MVADPQGQILDSKDYLAPIITPHEAMIAYNEDAQWTDEGYRLDFDAVAAARANPSMGTSSEGQADGDAGSALAIQAQRALQVTEAPPGGSHLVDARSAADFLVHKRTWKGVEAPLAGAEPKEAAAAVKGTFGRAAGYAHETMS